MAKQNDTTKPSLYHANLFGEPSRRDPEQAEIVNVSEDYAFPLQRCYLPDGREMYAVQDWIEGVAKPSDVRVFWQQMKKRLQKSQNELYMGCIQLPYLSSNGKTYQMDYADGMTLYGITQHMGVDTGIRNEVLKHLAKTGAAFDAARRDPEQAEIALNLKARQNALDDGKDPAWIAVREMGKVTRKQLTALLLNVSPKVRLDIATNNIYEGVLGDNADGLNAQLGLKPKSNPRDHMSRLALIYIMAGEEAVRLHLAPYADNEIVPPAVVYATIKTVAGTVGAQAQDVANQLKIDLVTGQKQISSKN
jgi:hypothetical protein